MSVRPKLRMSHVVVFSLVGILMVVSAFAGRAGISRAEDVIDEQWRGPYDILVTAPGGLDAVTYGSDAQGLRLIDQNYAAQTLPVIDPGDVAAIDQIEGIDVAAPAGFVGVLTDTVPYPAIFRDSGTWTDQSVQSFQIGWSITGNDGISPDNVLFSRDNTLTVDATDWNGENGLDFQVGAKRTTDVKPMDRGIILSQYWLMNELPDVLLWAQAPTFSTSIVAVDPVKESQLLVDNDFLQPLIEFDSLVAPQQITAQSDFRDGEPLRPELGSFPGTQPGKRPAPYGNYGLDSPFVGYIRNTDAYPPTLLTLRITETDADDAAGPGQTAHVDLGAQIRPFNSGDLALPWPGQQPDTTAATEQYSLNTNYTTTGLLPVKYGTADGRTDGVPGFEPQMRAITEPFFVSDSSVLDNRPDGTGQGEEISYRSAPENQLQIGTYQAQGAAPFEVGTMAPFDGHPLDSLGLYATANAAYAGGVLEPARTQQTLVTQTPSAIISLTGAEELTSTPVVSVVRVRVAGIEGLSRDEALDRMSSVSRDIKALGLETTVMAGSSREKIAINVPQYAFGTTDPDGTQKVGPLGWITTDATVLGVASWAAEFTGTTITQVTSLCLLIGGLGALGVAILSRKQRQNTHALLASLGWSTRDRLRWTFAEDWPGLAILTVGLCIAAIFAPREGVLAVAAAALVITLGIVIANPVKARGLSSSNPIGTRLQLAVLTLSEGVAAGFSAIIIGTSAALAVTFYGIITQTELGASIAGSLGSMLAALVIAAIVIVITTLVTAQTSRTVNQSRAQHCYWNLGDSRLRLIAVQTGRTILTTLVAGGLCLLAFTKSSGYAIDTQVFGIVTGAWLTIWLTIRLATSLAWKP